VFWTVEISAGTQEDCARLLRTEALAVDSNSQADRAVERSCMLSECMQAHWLVDGNEG